MNYCFDKQHIELSYITHFFCDQGNINSLTDLLKVYESYSFDVVSKIQFIIVDDCSPVKYEIENYNLNITWLRITDDIPWNQGGTRNLGVTHAKSDKIIITDLDHILPEETLKHLVKKNNPGRDFFKIYRKDSTGKIYKGHSNLFFMSRARFIRFFGYDEEYSGGYGGEDYRFVKFHKYHGSRQRYLSKKFVCYERELDRDNSYHNLVRDLSRNTIIDLKKEKEIYDYGFEHGHSRLFLNFKWEKVAEFQLPPPSYKKKRLWKHLWWFRWLSSALAK